MADCTHDNWIITGDESVGKCTCTDCGIEFPIWDAFNRLHDRMLEALERVNKMAETIGTIPKAAPKIKGQQKKHRTRKTRCKSKG